MGGPWDAADWSFREEALSCFVKQYHRLLIQGRIYMCACVCVCVCVHAFLIVCLSEDSFALWTLGVRTFLDGPHIL